MNRLKVGTQVKLTDEHESRSSTAPRRSATGSAWEQLSAIGRVRKAHLSSSTPMRNGATRFCRTSRSRT